jgi:hypothetical protein
MHACVRRTQHVDGPFASSTASQLLDAPVRGKAFQRRAARHHDTTDIWVRVAVRTAHEDRALAHTGTLGQVVVETLHESIALVATVPESVVQPQPATAAAQRSAGGAAGEKGDYIVNGCLMMRRARH